MARVAVIGSASLRRNLRGGAAAAGVEYAFFAAPQAALRRLAEGGFEGALVELGPHASKGRRPLDGPRPRCILRYE